jgi:hypothetical protein
MGILLVDNSSRTGLRRTEILQLEPDMLMAAVVAAATAVPVAVELATLMTIVLEVPISILMAWARMNCMRNRNIIELLAEG